MGMMFEHLRRRLMRVRAYDDEAAQVVGDVLDTAGGDALGRGRDLNLDSQGRSRRAPIHFDLHLVALDRHVLSDQREDLLARDLDQPGLANGDTLMREKNLQPLASSNGRTLRLGDRRRARALEKAKQPHAALRMNSVLKKLFRSLGTLMVTVSPLRRRAASE